MECVVLRQLMALYNHILYLDLVLTLAYLQVRLR